jgi:hypothetical protein
MRRHPSPPPPHQSAGRMALVCGAVAAALTFGACSSADSGPTGITAGNAIGKLCHELNRGGMPVTLTLELGSPAIARITARTGVCAPPAGEPCTLIPVGLVPLRLLEGDKVLTTRTVILHANEEYLFTPVVTTSGALAISGGPLNTGRCVPLDFPPPDGGVGDGGDGGGRDGAVAGDAGDAGAPDAAASDAAALDAGASDAAVDAAAEAGLAADAAPVDAASVDASTD